MVRKSVCCVALVIVHLPLHCLFAEEATKDLDANTKIVSHWLGVADELASRQMIAPVDSPDKKFRLVKKAVFRHSQPIRGDDIGAVYVWTTETERPAVIGVFFAWSQGRNRQVMEEFHSLHEVPIRRETQGHQTWVSETAGLGWNMAKGLPKPADDVRKLKLQSRQFPRTLKIRSEDFDEQKWNLRLAPKPFYEYRDGDLGIEYGAIFGFCQGTDTELLTIVEARKDETGKTSWYYAFAPFSDYDIQIELSDGKTWKSPEGRLGENGKPHYWNFVETRPKLDIE